MLVILISRSSITMFLRRGDKRHTTCSVVSSSVSCWKVALIAAPYPKCMAINDHFTGAACNKMLIPLQTNDDESYNVVMDASTV